MGIFKNIKSFFSTKVNTAVKNGLTKEDQYTKAATIIIDKIHELQQVDARSAAEIERLERKIREHEHRASQISGEIRIMKREDRVVPDAKYLLALQNTKIAEALKQRVEDTKTVVKNITTTVIELDDKLEEIKANLEFIRNSKESLALGIELPEDVTSTTNLAIADVNKLMMEVDTFIGGTNPVDVTSSDLAMFKDSFK